MPNEPTPPEHGAAGRRIVLRKASPPPAEPEAPPPASPEARTPSGVSSGIPRAIGDEAPRAALQKSPPVGAVLTAIGGLLLVAAPMAGWWRLSLDVAGAASAGLGDAFPPIPGIQRWPGFLCVALGALILMMTGAGLFESVASSVKHQLVIASAVVGGLAIALGLAAFLLAGTIVGAVPGFKVVALAPVHLAWLGGLLSAAGAWVRLTPQS